MEKFVKICCPPFSLFICCLFPEFCLALLLTLFIPNPCFPYHPINLSTSYCREAAGADVENDNHDPTDLSNRGAF